MKQNFLNKQNSKKWIKKIKLNKFKRSDKKQRNDSQQKIIHKKQFKQFQEQKLTLKKELKKQKRILEKKNKQIQKIQQLEQLAQQDPNNVKQVDNIFLFEEDLQEQQIQPQRYFTETKEELIYESKRKKKRTEYLNRACYYCLSDSHTKQDCIYKWVCWWCDLQGHSRHECDTRLFMRCQRCNQRGHKSDSCSIIMTKDGTNKDQMICFLCGDQHYQQCKYVYKGLDKLYQTRQTAHRSNEYIQASIEEIFSNKKINKLKNFSKRNFSF